MTSDEAIGLIRDNMLEVSSCLRSMSNEFSYLEGSMRSWISSSKNGHPHSSEQRRLQADNFFEAMEKLEGKFDVTLSDKAEFKHYVYSESIEDWYYVFLKILPSIRSELLDKLQSPLIRYYNLPRPLWASLLPDDFAKPVLPLFLAGQYLSAVRRGCDALRAVIREKTGIYHLDGIDLINQAYGRDRPFVIVALEGHSEENIQRGYSDLFRGAMAAIRNVHYHGTEELSEMDAARLIVLLGTLWMRACTTTRI